MPRSRNPKTPPSLVMLLVVGMIAVFVPRLSQAQQAGTIIGRVEQRASDAPIAGAAVAVVGTDIETVSNAVGEYVLENVPAGRRRILVSVPGYGAVHASITVATDAVHTLDIQLTHHAVEPDTLLRSTVAGPVRRRELGYGVQVITEATVDAAAARTLTELLQGRVAGLAVLNTDGQAGARRLLYGRGSRSLLLGNHPLLFVDGIRVSERPYPGSSQLNVATDPLDDLNLHDVERVEVIPGAFASAFAGREAAAGAIHVFTKRGRAGPPQWSFTMDQGVRWLGHVGPSAEINPTGLGLNDCSAGPDCPSSGSWLRAAHEQRYSALVRGGWGGSTYAFSSALRREAGVIPPQASRWWTLRANVGATPLRTLHIQTHAAFARRPIRWIGGGSSSAGFLSRVIVRDADIFFDDSASALLDIPRDQTISHLTVGTTISWKPLPPITHRLIVGFDRAASQYVEEHTDSLFGDRRFREANSYRSRMWTVDYSVAWEHHLSRHLESRLSWGVRLYDEGVNRHDSSIVEFEGGSAGRISRSRHEFTMRGLFVQERLAFGDRLFLTGGLRWDDAASNLGVGQDAEVLPHAQVSYSISDEPFWPSWWETFTLRAGMAWAVQTPSGRNLELEPIFVPAPPPGTERPDPITPENTREIDAGFQSSMFGGRLALAYSFYHARTTGALIRVPLSQPFLGAAVLRNAVVLRNRGHEVLADLTPLRARNLEWTIGVRWSTNHNEVSEVPSTILVLREGLPAPLYYGEVITNPDEVGVAPAFEQRFIGPVEPTSSYALETRLRIREHLTLHLLGEGHGDLFLSSGTAWLAARLGVWPECAGIHERVVAGDIADLTAGQQASCTPATDLDLWTFPARFFRLREASLTYRLPDGWVRPFGQAEVRIAARNLFLITDYPGLDPESANVENPGFGETRVELFNLPIPRSATLSLRLVL